MAKRKGKRRKSYRRKGKKGVSRKSKGPGLATEVGGLISAYKLAIENPYGGDLMPIFFLKSPNQSNLTEWAKTTKLAAGKTETWVPMVAGMAVHWGKNKPILNIIGKPLDALSKKYLKRGL